MNNEQRRSLMLARKDAVRWLEPFDQRPLTWKTDCLAPRSQVNPARRALAMTRLMMGTLPR